MAADAASIDGDFDLPLGSEEVVLADRYRIMPGSPISELETPGARAYVVRDLKNPNDLHFARICDPSIFPRVEVMVQLRHLREAHAIIPEEWGPVHWPPAGRSCFAVVFRRPEGSPIMPSLATPIGHIETETLVRSFLTPALQTLALFERRKITHRAIRPNNIFRSGLGGSIYMLGDCVAVPPAWGQSTIFETIESSMTPAEGRGKGTIADDIYALGATLLFLGLGKCPAVGLSENQLLSLKVEQGSFTALIGGEIAPAGLREPIRGMLIDDPVDRWTLSDLGQWVSGTLRRSARRVRDFKTDRPFRFQGVEYRNTRLLSRSLAEHWKDAAKAVRSKPFETWLQRGVPDADLAEHVSETIVGAGPSENELGDAKLISRICAQFDPEAPLRYKALTVMPDGMGHALAHAVENNDKESIGLIAELVQRGFAAEWFEAQINNGRVDLGLEAKTFKRLQQFTRQPGPGYGIERVLYELNPFLPCRGDMMSSAYVYSLRDLLPALNDIVADTGRLPKLIDRHVAAFIASRVTGSIDSQLMELEHGTGTSPTARIGMTGLLAKVQSEYQGPLVPHLTTWLVKDLEPALERYNSRSLRRRIKERLEEVAASGNVLELYQTLANKNILKRDERALKAAKREYQEASREIVRLESVEYQEEAKRTGWQIAAAISTVIGLVTTIGVFGS